MRISRMRFKVFSSNARRFRRAKEPFIKESFPIEKIIARIKLQDTRMRACAHHCGVRLNTSYHSHSTMPAILSTIKSGYRRDEKSRTMLMNDDEGCQSGGGKSNVKKTAQGQQWSAIPFALPYTFWESKMCTAGQRALLTITGPGPSFLKY